MTKDIAYIVELLRIINEYELVVIISCLIYYIIISISLYFIYLRIGKNKKNALIPVWNIITLLDLVSLPKLLIILVFMPYVNFIGIFVISIFINYRLGKALNLSALNRLGLILFPIIFMPLIATKNLEYTKLPPSRMLKEEEEEEEEEEEFVLDIKYNVDDVAVTAAFDVSQYINEEMYKEDKTAIKKDATSNEVADLTFDYNDIYNIKKDNEEEDNNMNNQEINNQIPVTTGTVNDNNLYSNQAVAQQPNSMYNAYNQTASMPTQGIMQQAQPVPQQITQVPGAVAPFQTNQVNPGVSTLNGYTASVSQPVTQQAVEPYYPSQNLVSYTRDYNSIYNIKTPVYEEVKQIVPANVTGETSNSKVLAHGENSISTLQMAAPPSFEETSNNDNYEEVVQTANPLVYSPVPESLVSMNIVEPEALPVAVPMKNNVPPTLEFNDLMGSTPMNDNNFDLLRPVADNNTSNNNFTNINMVGQMNNFDNNQNMSSQAINNIFVNDNSQFNNNDNNTQHANGSRFIQTDKSELPRRDYNNHQSTLDPILMSDPMSIFGSSSGLRPTSSEALREPQITPGGNDVCPNCGFLIKPGQPTCVVCGLRLM